MEIATSPSIPAPIAAKVEEAKVTRLELICDHLIEKSLFAMAFLIPLAMEEFTQEWYALPKVTVLRILTAIAIGAWLAKGVSRGRFSVAKTWLDVPIFSYLFVSLIATLLSASIYLSLFSNVFRQDGLITLLNFVIVFYLAATTVKREDRITRFLQVEVLSSIPVLILAFAQHFGYVFMTIEPNYFGMMRVFSTVGNPGFLGGYLVILIPMALVLGITSRSTSGKVLWGVMLVLLSVCLMYTYTRGAWLGIGVAVVAFAFLTRRRFIPVLPWLIVSIALVIVAVQAEEKGFFDPLKSVLKTSGGTQATQSADAAQSDVESDVSDTLGSMTDTSSGTGEARMLYWQGALALILDHPILGTGPSAFLPTFSKYAPMEYTRGEGFSRFPDKPHNVYLEVAAGTGVLGLVTFLAIFFVFGLKGLFWVWKKTERQDGLIGAALLSSWIGFLAYLFFLFFVMDTAVLFWLNMALMIGLMRAGESQRELRFDLGRTLRPAGYAAALVVGGFLIYLSIRPIVADYYMSQGRDNLKTVHSATTTELVNAKMQAARKFTELALQWNPYEVSYISNMAAVADVEAKIETDPVKRREKLDEEVAWYTKAIEVNPQMASLYYQRGLAFGNYGNDHLMDAYVDFQRSIDLYPYYYNGNAGLAEAADRLGKKDEAIVAERTLAEIFPHLTDNQLNLGADLYDAKRYKEAVAEWEKILKLEPDNTTALYRLGEGYTALGDNEKAAAEYRRVLELDPKNQPAQKALDILEGRAQPDNANSYH